MEVRAEADARGKPPRRRRLVWFIVVTVLSYGAVAYILLPSLWSHYEHQWRLASVRMKTTTAQGIPGDAVNVGLVGSNNDIMCAMHAAGWYPADALTFKSSLEIVGSVLLDHPYRDAPVSNLFLMGRKEDMSFEKPVGGSADRRHHVRLWKVLDTGSEGRPVWLGSATFDQGVGVSHYTGAITHRIAPDIDAERELIATDLTAADMVTARYQITGIGPTVLAWNGEGDRYYTDGEVWMIRLSPDCAKTTAPPEILPSPPAVELKDRLWQAVAGALPAGP